MDAVLDSAFGLMKAPRRFTSGPVWSLHEREHGLLRAAHPDNFWAHSVADGFKFNLTYMPEQPVIPPYEKRGRAAHLRVTAIREWIRRGFLEPIPSLHWSEYKSGARTLFFLHMFITRKPGKDGYWEYTQQNVLSLWRPCLDGKPLNEALACGHYKAHSDPHLDSMCRPTDLGNTADVEGAFNTLAPSTDPIDLDRWGLTSTADLACINTYDPEFATMAPHGFRATVGMFGFKPMPWIWQHCYQLLQLENARLGMRCGVCVDDTMTLYSDPRGKFHTALGLAEQTVVFIKQHNRYGVPLSSKEPMSLVPRNVVQFKGFRRDLAAQAKYIPLKRMQAYQRHALRMLEADHRGRQTSAASLATALGQARSMDQGVMGANRHSTGLCDNLAAVLNDPSNSGKVYSRALGFLSPAAVADLIFLSSEEMYSCNGRLVMHGRAISQTLTTDWSGRGMGAVLEPTLEHPNPPMISIPLPPSWLNVWSGAGELITAKRMIMAYAVDQKWNNIVISLLMDNVFAVSAINKMGCDIPELNTELEELDRFTRRFRICTRATWVEGATIVADEPSRRRANLWDCSLSQWIYVWLTGHFQFQPTFDLFATAENTKTVAYGSRWPDAGAKMVDSLTSRWPLHHRYYSFHPQVITTQVVEKTRNEGSEVLMVTPAWERHHFGAIVGMLVSYPVFFPMSGATMMDPHREADVPVLESLETATKRNWILAAYRISGDSLRVTAARASMRQLSLARSFAPTRRLLKEAGGNGEHTRKAWALMSVVHNLVKLKT